MELVAGTVLDGRFIVERPLAIGGTSRIYVGNPLAGAGMVAIKQVLIDSQGRERHEDYLQFRREFELLQALSHPALPRALAFFEEGGHHYLIEEFVPGRTLEEVLGERGRLPVEEALGVLMPLLDVLAYLHEYKVVYRDLKPSNVLITKAGAVRLIDLGAARRWRPGAAKDTVPLGTPGYAPPEAYGRGQTDARSDVYSAGVLLHQMLTGRDPAEGEAWKFEAPEGVAEHLRDAVMKAVALDPDERFGSIDEMSLSLQEPRECSKKACDLGALRYRVTYTDPPDYRRENQGLEAATESLLAVVGFSLSYPIRVAAWGLRWWRYHGLSVMVHEAGMRVQNKGETVEVMWDDLQSVHLVMPNVGTEALSADISTGLAKVTLQGDWPGFRVVLDEVIARADMRETSNSWSQYPYVGTHVRTFERVS